MEIDQARLLTLYAAWQMDTYGKKEARREISMIKVVAANVVMDVLDRAIQVHGALGMSDDTPLAGMWRYSRMLKVADGPDEVHKMVIARRELNRWAKRDEPRQRRGRCRASPRPARTQLREPRPPQRRLGPVSASRRSASSAASARRSTLSREARCRPSSAPRRRAPYWPAE